MNLLDAPRGRPPVYIPKFGHSNGKSLKAVKLFEKYWGSAPTAILTADNISEKN